MAARTGTCDSCGSDVDDLEEVRRMYVTPETWETEASSTVVDEVEAWCFPCRSMYPHQRVEAEASEG